LERRGEVVTREELRQKLWGSQTFVDFQHGLNKGINRLREALGDQAANPRYIETLPRFGYRFIGHLDDTDASDHNHPAEVQKDESTSGIGKLWKTLIPATTVLVALVAAGYLYSHRAPKLTEKDTIVLGDFTNSTGDSVFDGALRQGLEVQLEQSPLLRLVPEEQIQQTLRMMKQPLDAKLTPENAWQVCQRTNSTTVLNASIAQVGAQYSLILKAVSCVNGQVLASTEAQSRDKSHVLEALGRASTDIRKKLGESAATVQKFDTPLEQATTPSLEALQAFSLGFTTLTRRADSAAALPMLQQAVKIDPNFAMAYVVLSACYHNLGETTLASESARKAFELRLGTSERERLLIEAVYHFHVTGDFEKALRLTEVRGQLYPSDPLARIDMGLIYAAFGQYDKSLAEHRESVRLFPVGACYENLIAAYVALNRLDEARATLDEAKAKAPDFPAQPFLYALAFLRDDPAAMANVAGCCEAETAAYLGQMEKARKFYDQAVSSAERAEEKEAAADVEANAALTEGVFGDKKEARSRAGAALRLSTGRDAEYLTALALASVGDAVQAQALGDDLAKRFPENSVVQFNYLPTLRAQLALSRKSPSSAIENLRAAAPYELGSVGRGTLYPVYVRGLAYLAAHQGAEAAVEFQKILDHRGIVLYDPIGALSHLRMGRAYALAGDSRKAMDAYQKFLALWKNADVNLPILKQAKVEYARLQ
jgi:tetratricopeptide (TPR) repeat protein